MISISLKTLIRVLDSGKALNIQVPEVDSIIHSVSTDTRTIEKGALFIALVGDKFDAHDFCQQAKEKGASALLVSRKVPVELPQILVKDTRIALGQLASWVHKKCQIETLAITGSCGKTTVKEMVYSILSLRGNVLATIGNFNNDIGVPLTLLRSEPRHDFAVIELGANHLGEIAYTTELVKPRVALVNNVEAAHLEGFGSIDGVKKAKGEIYQGLSNGDTAIINLDSQGADYWHEILNNKKIISFSMLNSRADYYASDIQINSQGNVRFTLNSPQGSTFVELSVVGKHNVSNALAAAALSIEFGATLLDVAQGLSTVVNAQGRVEIKKLNHNITLIDDTYNASVPAMKAAIDLLSTYKGVRWLVLGHMAELGQESLEIHRQLGDYAAQFCFENVLTIGNDTRVISEICQGQHFSTHEALIEYLESQLRKVSGQIHTLLIKGAHSAHMGIVSEVLKEKHQ